METRLVSVVMPAYNGATYIEQAITSVITQTYPHWELIVVDDGSTDNTAEIVAALKESRIRYFYQENRGQAAALNRGLDLARGEYITTLDTDDWFTPDSLLERVRFLDKHPEYGAVYGDGYYCNAKGQKLLRFSEHRVDNVRGDVYDILITTPFFGTGANVTVRRQVFDQYQIRYDETIVWCQDYDLYIRIAEKVAFGLIDTATLWYRLHQANMTMSMPRGRRLESLIRTRFKVLASPRFATVATPLKIAFFSHLLIEELYGRLEDQEAVVNSPPFRALPSQAQARLLRLVASNYLMKGQNLATAKNWLKQARVLAPFNLKTLSATALAHLNPNLTRLVVKYWRQIRTQRQKFQSPFEMAKGL